MVPQVLVRVETVDLFDPLVRRIGDQYFAAILQAHALDASPRTFAYIHFAG